MAGRVTRPWFGFAAETGRFITIDASSTISCFCALLPSSFLHCPRPYSGMFLFVLIILCPCSSHLLHVSKYVCTPCVICILLSLRIPFVYLFHTGCASNFPAGGSVRRTAKKLKRKTEAKEYTDIRTYNIHRCILWSRCLWKNVYPHPGGGI